MLKPVAALPGDVVQRTAAGLLINGQLLPNSTVLTADSHGRALDGLGDDPILIGDGEAFLVSTTNDHSFDSRYFGPVPRSIIEGVAVPVLVAGRVAR